MSCGHKPRSLCSPRPAPSRQLHQIHFLPEDAPPHEASRLAEAKHSKVNFMGRLTLAKLTHQHVVALPGLEQPTLPQGRRPQPRSRPPRGAQRGGRAACLSLGTRAPLPSHGPGQRLTRTAAGPGAAGALGSPPAAPVEGAQAAGTPGCTPAPCQQLVTHTSEKRSGC